MDCRFNLVQPDAGRAAYHAGHIPGAWYADLDRDLAGPRRPAQAGIPCPNPAAAALFGGFGIARRPGRRLRRGGWGHCGPPLVAAALDGPPPVVLLDGGLAAWRRAGLPLSQAAGARPVRFDGGPGHMPVMDTAQVVAALAGGAIRLLDARAEERFLGRVEPIDPVAGHVPGAVNVPFAGNLAADNRFQTPQQLAERYAPLSRAEPEEIVCMCGSGVTACHGIFALELGNAGAVLYPGSWSEWIRSSGRPVATG